MQRKQRNPFYLFRSTFSFLWTAAAKSQQLTNTKSEQVIKHQSKIANLAIWDFISCCSLAFLSIRSSHKNCNKNTKNIYPHKTMSDNDAKMAAVDSSSPMSDINPQSPITSPPSNHLHQNHNHHTSTDNINHQNTTTATSPTPHESNSLSSHNKRSRGRPRKYHTDAEREEAKRRYRENHKTKAASSSGVAATGGAGGAGNASVGALTAVAAGATATTFAPGYEGAKQRDVDELWGVVRVLQEEVRGLREELAQRDGDATAASAGQKRKKVW
jgi:hypothetical protein